MPDRAPLTSLQREAEGQDGDRNSSAGLNRRSPGAVMRTLSGG
jgi:hypothetical protein